jgi:hypothetical protein
MKEGVVEHETGSATVSSNSPRPMAQAIEAIRQEYGWMIDYEDPPYANEPDLIDVTDPEWRATHPGARGARGIAGGFFQSRYDESAPVQTRETKEAILKKIVADYNSSGNPGKFTLRAEGGDRYAVTGISVKDSQGKEQIVTPVLDTQISIPVEQRTVLQTIRAIAQAIGDTRGTTVSSGLIPIHLFSQSQVTVGGKTVPARLLLTQALDGTGRPCHWRLLFDPANENTFVLNVDIAVRVSRDTYGGRRLLPIDYPPKQPN